MTGRVLKFILTRRGVLVPGLIAGLLFATGTAKVAGIILLMVAGFNALRLLRYDDLDERLRLKQQKEQHGIRRLLRDSERLEILALGRYGEALRAAGAEASLCDEPLEQGWRLLAERGPHDSTSALRRFRVGLPSLAPGAADSGEQSVANESALTPRLEREVWLMRAARREVEMVR